MEKTHLKCALVGCFPPGKGALSEYSYHLAKGLAANGEVVTVLCDKVPLSPTEESPTNNVRVIRCWQVNSIITPLIIWNNIRHIRPDVVYINTHIGITFSKNIVINAVCLLVLPILLKVSRYCTVLLMHDFPEIVDISATTYKGKGYLIPFGHLLTKILLMISSGTVVLSRNFVKVITDQYKHAKIGYIPHGVFELIDKVPIGERKIKRLLVFGKMSPSKDFHLVFEAWKELRTAVSDLELTIAGDVHPATPEFQSVVNNMAEKANTQFIGAVPESQLGELFTESTLVILPYRTTTGVSGCLHLACGYGIPPVLPSLPELISITKELDVKAFYYQPGNAKDFVRVVTLALQNKEQRYQIAEHNLEIAKKYHFGKTIECLLEFTRNVACVRDVS
ncbi:glycosyltransferase [Chloroflexota bacterium]